MGRLARPDRPEQLERERFSYCAECPDRPPLTFGRAPAGRAPNTKPGLRVAMTLEQAYPPGCRGVQCAFKDSMIHVSAIHVTYRISLRSSSTLEPRDPLLKVFVPFR